jgi:hypothetical protein
LGKILGSISPAFGLASGKGLFGSDAFKDVAGTLIPGYGAVSGNGLGGALFNPGSKGEAADGSEPKSNRLYDIGQVVDDAVTPEELQGQGQPQAPHSSDGVPMILKALFSKLRQR